MSTLFLERFSYSPTETEGYLFLRDDTVLHTLERPWIGEHPGGTPFESCIPDGEYQLIPHVRPNGHSVYAMRNHDLHVYYTAEERGENPGRYLCLLHSGNYVDDVVGCIAPGLVRTIYRNRRMVTSSRAAMRKIMADNYKRIVIATRCGTDYE